MDGNDSKDVDIVRVTKQTSLYKVKSIITTGSCGGAGWISLSEQRPPFHLGTSGGH